MAASLAICAGLGRPPRGAKDVLAGFGRTEVIHLNFRWMEKYILLFVEILQENKINFYLLRSASSIGAAIMSISNSNAANWAGASPDVRTQSAPRLNEDWLSVIIGLFIFVLGLAVLANVDLIGWSVTTSVWNNIALALGTTSKAYASLGGFGALIATYLALLVVLGAGALALDTDVKKFALAFTAVFWIAYASWIVGNFANFAAATPAEQQKFGISWSLRLTNEGGYIFALIAGLVIANGFPRFADAIKDAVRPEL